MLTDDLTTIYKKSKYAKLFDVAALSLHSANGIGEDMNAILKEGAKVYVETVEMVVIMKEEQKAAFLTKAREKATQASWKEQKSIYSHHLLFQAP